MTKTKLIFATAFSLLTIARAIDAYRDANAEEVVKPSPPSVLSPLPAPVIEAPPADVPAPPLVNKPVALSQAGHSDIRFGNLVKLRARASHRFVRDNQTSDLYVQIDLDGHKKAMVERPGLSVAVVIDRSGSMDGEKMRHTKRATKQLIKRLKNKDKISIISYSNTEQVNLHLTDIGDIGRPSIEEIVDQLYAAGGTNLSAGLTRAIAMLKQSKDTTHIKRVIIMSDGNANQGITSSHQLGEIVRKARNSGVSITSIGVGLDFNEDLMTVLAEHGGGRYHFVEDSSSIATALGQEMIGLSDVIAQQLEVEMQLPSYVRMKQVFGFPMHKAGKTISIPVGDISRGEHRQIVARLKVSTKDAGFLPLGKIRLKYVPARTQARKTLAKPISIAVTANESQLHTSEVLDVAETVNAVLVAQTRIEVAKDFAKGDRAGALSKLRKGMKRTKSAASRLGSNLLSDIYNELESSSQSLQNVAPESEQAKSYIKSEKNRARTMQVY